MVDLYDLNSLGEIGSAQGKAVHTRADDHVLTNAVGHGSLQSVLCPSASQNHRRIRRARAEGCCQRSIERLEILDANPAGNKNGSALRIRNESVSPSVVN